MEPNNKYPDKLRQISENKLNRNKLDNSTKKSFNVSMSATEKEWRRKKDAVKLLKINNITLSEYLSATLLQLDQNLIDELIRLNVLKKSD